MYKEQNVIYFPLKYSNWKLFYFCVCFTNSCFTSQKLAACERIEKGLSFQTEKKLNQSSRSKDKSYEAKCKLKLTCLFFSLQTFVGEDIIYLSFFFFKNYNQGIGRNSLLSPCYNLRLFCQKLYKLKELTIKSK